MNNIGFATVLAVRDVGGFKWAGSFTTST